MCFFFFSSRRRHTRCALVTGVQTCALPIYPEPDSGFAPPDLSDEQTAAAAELKDAVAAAKFETLLLDGVTGSGKTEVYMEAIAAAIDAGQQALVLLPEIALTEPMLTRFAARFGCEPVAWHSGLRSTERRRARSEEPTSELQSLKRIPAA